MAIEVTARDTTSGKTETITLAADTVALVVDGEIWVLPRKPRMGAK